jgi:hypothetical protein
VALLLQAAPTPPAQSPLAHLQPLVGVQQQPGGGVAHVRQLRAERLPAVLQLGLPRIQRPLQLSQHAAGSFGQLLCALRLLGCRRRGCLLCLGL